MGRWKDVRAYCRAQLFFPSYSLAPERRYLAGCNKPTDQDGVGSRLRFSALYRRPIGRKHPLKPLSMYWLDIIGTIWYQVTTDIRKWGLRISDMHT